MVYIYPSATEATGIHALRYGEHKAHFVTQGGIFAANEDLDCIRFAQVLIYVMCLFSIIQIIYIQSHSPPIIYNVEHDPSERYPVTEENEPNYQEILETLLNMKDDIEAGLTWAPPRNALYGDIAIPCCNRGCQPFPSCCSCSEK